MPTEIVESPIDIDTDRLIGFGLDYQYADKYVFGGLSGLCQKFNDQLAHLSIVSIPDLIEAETFNRIILNDLPKIHHLSGIAPANPIGPNIELLKKQVEISKVLQAKWCLEDIGIWSLGPYDIPYFVPPVFNLQVVKLVAERIKQIEDIVNIPFLAEVPSCSFVVGDLPLGDFFHYLINNTSCKMVLDVSHVFSYALATNSNSLDILHSLPLEATWEIHIAGGRVNKNYPYRYIDTHSDPIHEEVLRILEEAIKLCGNLQAITYEIGMKSTEELITTDFQRLNSLVANTCFKPFSSLCPA
jgi:uncharacterized protein (UPF0276 family)